MSQFKVLVPIPIFSQQCAEARAMLEAHGMEVIQNTFGLPFDMNRFQDELPEIDAVICGIETWGAREMERLPKLKILSRFGVGVDNIDLEAAKARGIICTRAVGINTYAVAEFAVTSMLAMLRRVVLLDRETKSGQWIKHQGEELAGKTVGLIGFGAIARQVAKLLQGFSVRILAYDAYPNQQAAEQLGVTLTSLDQVLAESHILSLHLPGTPETKHLIGAEAFSKMRRGAYLVNTSRGAVVDEAAAYEALSSGKLAGMTSDVFDPEPPAYNHPLFKLDHFFCSPHVAAATVEANRKTSLLAVQNVIDCLEGRTPCNIL